MAIFRAGKRQAGIYFLSTLVVSAMMAMLVLSSISVTRGSLSASRHLSGGDSALKAAESGLRYAQARLGANPLWRGDGNGVIVNSPDLIVEEHEGNVIGILRASDGEWSQFRIRFNWQDDGSGDLDGFPDPVATSRVDIPYVSYNNTAGGSSAEVPRADGPGHSVTPNSPRPYTVPTGTACLLIEGRAGRGLALGPGNLNPSVAPGGQFSSKIVESYLRVKGQPGADAAAMAAGDIVAKLRSEEKVTVSSKSGPPRVRSKAQVKVENGNAQENYVSNQGEVHAQDSDLHANFDPSKVGTYQEDVDSEFYKLEWDDVKKAEPTDAKVAAGTYVLWDDGSLHYYNMSYQAYAAHIQANPTDPGTPAALDSASMQLNGTTLEVTANTYVEPTGATNEFNLIPRKGAQEDLPGLNLSGSGTLADQNSEFQAIVDDSPFVSQPGGLEKATWTIPLANPLPANVYIEQGVPANGTGWNLSLIDDGNGTGRLILNDLYQSNLGVPVDDNPRLALTQALQILVSSSNPDYATLLSYVSSGGHTTMKELDLPGVTTNLSADQVKVKFKPPGGKSAILSAEGNVRLGSRVEGEGGSITSGGTIRLVGSGSKLSANIEDGLNLYAKGDVVLSSLRPNSDGTFDFKSFEMKGVIYTWGDFTAKIGYDSPTVNGWGKFKLTGALVSYGSRGNSVLGTPGNGAGGAIDIRAREVDLTFDPAYLVAFRRVPDPGPLRQTFRTVY